MKSLKELFRIGLGPSSSHTMGPGFAAGEFLRRYPEAASYRVELQGSLAATGRGHLTDRAILRVLPEAKTGILWHPEIIPAFHPNGMHFSALDAAGRIQGEWTVYSVGGGALRTEGDPEDTPEVYPLQNFSDAVAWSEREGRPLWRLPDAYDAPDIRDHFAKVWLQMKSSIEAGLNKDDVLPGDLHLARKACSVYAKAKLHQKSFRRTGLVSAYALAACEENASGNMVVTAPTCGSCGVLPAVLRYSQEWLECTDEQILNAIAVAGIVGNTAKQNGSISGAEVGCQGEVGVACAMAAAAAASLLGGTAPQIEYAAEIGLEHFLGLTCDPVLGLVQIPCIERNALAANRSMVAAEYALLSDGKHRVSFDNVVSVMKSTGHDLPALYRETAGGGLAMVVH